MTRHCQLDYLVIFYSETSHAGNTFAIFNEYSGATLV